MNGTLINFPRDFNEATVAGDSVVVSLSLVVSHTPSYEKRLSNRINSNIIRGTFLFDCRTLTRRTVSIKNKIKVRKIDGHILF